MKPKEASKLLHDVHKSNLVKLVNTDYPNLFGEIVGYLLTLSESQSLDPEVKLFAKTIQKNLNTNSRHFARFGLTSPTVS